MFQEKRLLSVLSLHDALVIWQLITTSRTLLQNRGIFNRVTLLLRRIAKHYGRLLHRILHRFREMVVCDLQIVFSGDRFAVANPFADNVAWKLLFQFSLPCRA